jgi:hypothetical protein
LSLYLNFWLLNFNLNYFRVRAHFRWDLMPIDRDLKSH